ncbi:MAG TPA: DsrE/DsrF/DrsH-like family protein [Candidatus Nitrosotalea sp.]|nr:DsrE/DsrF/DrsH-like family protein [Candidatus Nitrosotalea sp.]
MTAVAAANVPRAFTAATTGVEPVTCQMTTGRLGLRREELVDGLEAPPGAAAALADAQGAI